MDILDQFIGQGLPASTVIKKKETTQKVEMPKIKDPFEYGKKPPTATHSQKISDIKTQLSYEDKMSMFSHDFIIPVFPSGKTLEFNILSTWGDMNYVGLTGIEIFDSEGVSIRIGESQITACPPDINILPGYGGDPRTVEKLVDGHYFTNDDLHVWLTPFTTGEDHTITIEFTLKTTISMIRIWNYNKSRIHSYRGARLLTCQLDGKPIFRGEIQKAPGNLNDPESCCELLLFTDSDFVMEKIDRNDWINEQLVQSRSTFEDTQKIQDGGVFGGGFKEEERPLTATKKFNTSEIEEIQRQLRGMKPTSLFDERPQTSAIITGDQPSDGDSRIIPKAIGGGKNQ